MELTLYLVIGQHNSLSQHPVSLYNFKRNRPNWGQKKKKWEHNLGCRCADLYATIWTKKAMRFKNADITPGHGHTKFGGWSRLRLLKIKGNPFLEAPYKERKEIVICRENLELWRNRDQKAKENGTAGVGRGREREKKRDWREASRKNQEASLNWTGTTVRATNWRILTRKEFTEGVIWWFRGCRDYISDLEPGINLKTSLRFLEN